MSHSTPISVCREHGVIVGPRCKCPGPHPEVKVDCPDEAKCLARLDAIEERTVAAAESWGETLRTGKRRFVWVDGVLRAVADNDYSPPDGLRRALSTGTVVTGYMPCLTTPDARRRWAPNKHATHVARGLRFLANRLMVARSIGEGESSDQRGEWAEIASMLEYCADRLAGPSDS